MGARVGFPTSCQSIVHRFMSKLPVCNTRSTYFLSGQDNSMIGQFWAVGRFNLLGGQSNLLGGQMPTQLTCYLPPCGSLTH